jgi:hypothetical protein
MLGVGPGDRLAGYAGEEKWERRYGIEKGARGFAKGVEEDIVESDGDGVGEKNESADTER